MQRLKIMENPRDTLKYPGDSLSKNLLVQSSQSSFLVCKRVAHTVLLLRIGEYTLNLLFSQTVQLFVYRHMADMLRHLHIVLPNMAQDCFLTLGIFSTHSSAGTAFAKIGPAFVFPITVPVCGGIMQRTVLRADHIIKVFVIHIRPPGMAVLFAFWTGITSGKNAYFLRFLPAFFITLSLSLREKGHLSVTFFDRLRTLRLLEGPAFTGFLFLF